MFGELDSLVVLADLLSALHQDSPPSPMRDWRLPLQRTLYAGSAPGPIIWRHLRN
jgi:hypothetical protein